MGVSELWISIRSKAVAPLQHSSLKLGPIHEDDYEREADILDRPPDAPSLIPTIAGTSCIIGYANSKGEASERLVTCQRLDDHANIKYLWAYCHSRQRVRQFRVDRIVHVVDALTGEQLPSVASYFNQFEVDRSHASQPGWGLSVNAKSDFVALLNALVFLARCDRKFHALEREAIEDVVCSFWLRFEHAGEPDCASILAYADRLAPDAETFWISMLRCANSPKLTALLKQAARKVIDADGVITKEEFYWASKVDAFVAELAL